jgi:CheY-like chemotaxis protein
MSRVLLVEDCSRRVYAMKEAGIVPLDALVVDSAAEGVQAVLAQVWDEVFLDYDLTGRAKGSEVARALTQVPWRAQKVHIHSTNTEGGLQMRYILAAAGIEASWVPVTKLLPGLGLD